MKHTLSSVITAFIILIITPLTTFAEEPFQYDHVLGQKLTIEDIEPPGNYDLEVFFNEQQAVEHIFTDCDSVFIDNLVLDPQQKQNLQDRIKAEIAEHSFAVFIGKKQGVIAKYAIITEEKGCFHPITFIVGVNADGSVDNVAIMAYRESRGRDVARARFLHQYKGKTVNDPIRMNRDIIHLTGATTSVRGVNRGVRKALAALDQFYLNGERGANAKPYQANSAGYSDGAESALYSQAYVMTDGIMEAVITNVSEAAASVAFKELAKEALRLNLKIGKSVKKSEINIINKKGAKKPQKCGKELFEIIKTAIDYSNLTGGNLDIAEGFLIEKLKNSKKKRKPDKLQKLYNAATYKNIELNRGDGKGFGSVSLKEKSTGIDITLLSKGYIVDRAVDKLKSSGIANALVSFAGVTKAIGTSQNGKNWKIAVPNPMEKGVSAGFIEIKDMAVAITGDYEREYINIRKMLAEDFSLAGQRPFNVDMFNIVATSPSAFEANVITSAMYLSASTDLKLVSDNPGSEGLVFYKSDAGGLGQKMTEGMKTLFSEKREAISTKRHKPSCAF